MAAITMTAAEMAVYDSDDEVAVTALIERLYVRAARLAAEIGQSVEIRTPDDMLAGCADSSHLN